MTCAGHLPISWWAVSAVLWPYLLMVTDDRASKRENTLLPAGTTGLVEKRLKTLATSWNLFMTVFSAWGLWHMWELLWHPAQLAHFERFERAAAWYVFSKFWELVDTVLLYARGRPISSLHWTHHVLTLVYSVFAYNQCSHAAVYFSALNYAVHTLMYAYYASLHWWPGWRQHGHYVTVVQILQFAWAMIFTWLYEAHFAWGTYSTAWLMYSYYFFEFVSLWRQRRRVSQ